MRTIIPKIICTALIPSGIKNIYFPICFTYMSSEIRAKTPNSITNNSKAENTQTRILKIVRKVRERYRSGMIHSIKKNQPSIIASPNSSKGKNKHPISEEPFFLMLSLYPLPPDFARDNRSPRLAYRSDICAIFHNLRRMCLISVRICGILFEKEGSHAPRPIRLRLRQRLA